MSQYQGLASFARGLGSRPRPDEDSMQRHPRPTASRARSLRSWLKPGALATLTVALGAAGVAAQATNPPRDLHRGARTAFYTIKATTLESNEDGTIPLEIALRVDNPPAGRCVFEIPVWTPGSYVRREFPNRIRDVSATGPGGESLDVLRLNPSSWQVRSGDAEQVTFNYTVLLTGRDRSMYRDEDRRALTWEGPRVYMLLRDNKNIPCTVRFDLPDGWGVYSGLLPRSDGTHFAQDYDFLADCPTKIGMCQVIPFDSRNCRFELVVDSYEDLPIDEEEWIKRCRAISEACADVFGAGVDYPMDRYVYLFTAHRNGGGGGLEHLNSTNIDTSSAALARTPASQDGITAHEFFHTWNVKRVRPVELGPFDYSEENYTHSMWVAEGWTSYYTTVTLSRAGMRTPENFWAANLRNIQSWERNATRFVTPATESSYRYWLQKPRDRIVSYYTAGQVLGFLLDLEIRHATENANSLDDVMQGLWRHCRTLGRGYTEGELISICSQVAGKDLSEWFDTYVYGTVRPDYERILGYAGFRAEVDATMDKVLRGVSFARVRDGDGGDASLRILFSDNNRLDGGDRSGALEPFGLAGDLVAIDGQAISSPEDVVAVLEGKAVDTELEVVYRDQFGRERSAWAMVEERPGTFTLDARMVDDPTPLQLAIREGITQAK